MDDELQQIKSRSLVSIFSLFFQSGYAAALGLVANLVLTILLTPKIFGIYVTTLSLISFLNYFSDIGLAASLIQKKEIDNEDVKTVFTFQQILIIALISIGFAISSIIQKFYNLPPEGIYLYWALLVSFFISSLKTIPSIFLERKIQFQKIVLVQIVESTVFYISVIILAIMKFGLYSFTIAVFLRAISGLIVIYSLSFWVPQIGISIKHLKQLLSFGIPFQASSFLALFKDDLIILYLGKVLGFEGVGYIGWAKKWAEAPIRIVMDNLNRVIFPLIARFQHDNRKVKQLIEKVFYYQTALLAPTMLGAIFVMPQIVNILPHYHKWLPALPIFFIFCISSYLVSYTGPLINLFNALGKVKLSLFFMITWTVIMWVLTPTLTSLYGLYGFPITHLLISATSIFVVYAANQFLHFDFFRQISKFVLSAIIMFVLFIATITSLHTIPLLMIIILTLIGSASYLLSLQFLFRTNILIEAKTFLFNRSS